VARSSLDLWTCEGPTKDLARWEDFENARHFVVPPKCRSEIGLFTLNQHASYVDLIPVSLISG